MRHLAIDWGSKKVGIALSDEKGFFSFPHSVIPNDDNFLLELKDIVEEYNVEKIIIGESKNYKGSNNPIMEEIERVKEEIEGELSLSVEFENEILTSKEAERIQGRNDMIDASAAALILKSYLERKHDNN